MIELSKLLRWARDRRKVLMEDTFATPPADWSGFQKALGAYAEITAQVQEIERMLEATENDDDDDLPDNVDKRPNNRGR